MLATQGKIWISSQALSPDLIESHASNILSRALNIGRVVAFVGAGVSMSYGRLSWGGLVGVQIERIKRKGKELIDEQNKNAEDHLPEERDRIINKISHIKKLYDTLNALTTDRNVKPEHNPMLFQMCEQLESAISNYKFHENSVRSDSETVRNSAQDLLIDSLGHAKQIWRDAFVSTRRIDWEADGGLSIDSRDEIRDFNKRIEGIGEYFITSIFTKDMVKEIKDKPWIYNDRDPTAVTAQFDKQMVEVISNFRNSVSESIDSRSIDKPYEYLLPVDRHLFGFFVKLASRTTVTDTIAKIEEHIRSNLRKSRTVGKDRLPRDKLLPPSRDPLLLIYKRLRVHRFITTNYDHEIENFFSDIGLNRQPRIDKKADKGEEEPLRDLQAQNFDVNVFDPQKAASLFEFSARERYSPSGVVHLHGRAERPANRGKIIVTERDYQLQYAVLDETRDLVDAAIRTAFASNPILFVGSNMGEDDILRPMRQFMGASRLSDRVAVAILPRLNDRPTIDEEKIALLARYGVYSMHFGLASFPDSTEVKRSRLVNRIVQSPVSSHDDARLASTYWLPWIWNIKKIAEHALRPLADRAKLVSDARTRFRANPAGHTIQDFIRSLQFPLQTAISKIEGILQDTYMDAERSSQTIDGDKEVSKHYVLKDEVTGQLVLNTPVTIEFIDISSDHSRDTPDLTLEIAAITATIKTLRSLSNELGHWSMQSYDLQDSWMIFRPKLEYWHHIAIAFLGLIQGVGDSMLSAFTCARIQRAQWDQEVWKRRWQEVPAARDIWQGEANYLRNEIGKKKDKIDGSRSRNEGAPEPAIVSWHGVDISSDVDGGRFFSDAPSQSLNGLMRALHTPDGQAFASSAAGGRRILILVSRRGVGKGHFFAVLRGSKVSTNRLSPFLKALSDQNSETHKPRWLICGFFNLSFSHESMSAFDRIIDIIGETFLENCQSPEVKHQTEIGLRALKRNRLGRLDFVLTQWVKALSGVVGQATHRRVMVAINNISVLFDAGGSPKNGQVKQLFALLTSPRFVRLPIDLIFLSDFARVPQVLRVHEAVHLIRHPIDEQRRKDVEAIFRQIVPIGENREISDPIGSIAFHVLHETRASILGAAFFPRIMIILSRKEWLESNQMQTQQDFAIDIPKVFADPAAIDIKKSIRSLIDSFESDSTIPVLRVGDVIPLIFAAFPIFLENDKHFTELKFADFVDVVSKNIPLLRGEDNTQTRSHGVPEREDKFIETLRMLNKGIQLEFNPLDYGEGQEAKSSVAAIARRIDNRLKHIFDAAGRSRYATTLIFAAAFELTTGLTAACGARYEESTPPKSVRDHLDETTRRIDRFLSRLELELRSTPRSRRFELVLQEYFELLDRHHEREDFLPYHLRLPTPASQFDAYGMTFLVEKSGPKLFRLMREVIQHIAVIGQPVQGEVIAYCPRVRKLAIDFLNDEWSKISGGDETESDIFAKDILIVVDETLSLLENRCLVFRVENPLQYRETDVYDHKKSLRRYTVHGLVQSFMFKSLGGQHSEFHDVDRHTVTLYTTQPTDLPRLSVDAYRQMTETIEMLIGYPEKDGWYHSFIAIAPKTRSRMLRAAYGMMRSIYSIAVLSRFDQFDEEGQEEEPALGGYFERYRRMLRWILSSAARLKEEHPSADVPSPFHAEEIVWMYNESAVLSLIQGRISDAGALFNTAAGVTRNEIEPDARGPLNIRIDLNRAIVLIELGHLTEARALLSPIAQLTESTEHPIPILIAKGYLGLLQHISGNIEAALSIYDETISALHGKDRTRAECIFIRHKCDLLRTRGTDQDLTDALRLADTAILLAFEGGHEDIRQYALLSRAKILLRKTDRSVSPEIHRTLDMVERYANLVGVPRLTAEVAELKARMLLQQGEQRLAVHLAARALEVTSMNDLRLRKVSAIATLAEALLERGQSSDAGPLLRAGLDLAKSTGHMLARNRLERAMSRITV